MARIIYKVPVVRQGQNPICWVACAAMVLSFKEKRSVTVGEINNGFDPSNSSMKNPAATWDAFYDILDGLGFVSTGPQMSPGVAYIEDILSIYGPFILTHYTKTLAPKSTDPGTHAVIITGVDTRIRKCFYNNPWGKANIDVPAATIQGAMESLWLTGIRSVAYVP